MTEGNLAAIVPIRKVISIIPDTDLSRLIREGLALATRAPRILDLIMQDIDTYALKKKKFRAEDKAYWASRGGGFPGFSSDAGNEWQNGNALSIGRPRMAAEVVLIFILIRGYLGGFKDKKVMMVLSESRTFEIVLKNFGIRMPGASTVFENVNAVGPATHEAILNAQVRVVIEEGLDDFKEMTFDSTKVEANSAWPTDSGTITGLVFRAEGMLRELAEYRIVMHLPAILGSMMTSIRDFHKQIQLTSGKKDSEIKRKKLYRKLTKAARKARAFLAMGLERVRQKQEKLEAEPSRMRSITNLINWISADVKSLGVSIDNTAARVLRNEKVPASEKIVSLSDDDAAMIVKGGREPAVGYKPQIGRSKNGFITAIIVPKGNANDSDQLEPIVEASIKRTGIIPRVLSFDDGYTNTEDLERYLKRGVGVVSFSGSKGKRLIPAEDYDSKSYQTVRNDRSAVESLMFTIKHNHDFEDLMRRGIENVRSELLGKVLAYNTFRIIKLLQDRQVQKLAA